MELVGKFKENSGRNFLNLMKRSIRFQRKFRRKLKKSGMNCAYSKKKKLSKFFIQFANFISTVNQNFEYNFEKVKLQKIWKL